MVRLLEVLIDPETVSIRDVPVDDQSESEEEARAVARSKDWLKNNKGIPFDEVTADLDFTMEQVTGHRKSTV